MNVRYIAPASIAAHTGDYAAAGLTAPPPAPAPLTRPWKRDLAVVAALICLAIFI